MKTFTDKKGIEWTIDLDLEKIKRIEAYDFSVALRKESEDGGPVCISIFPPEKDLFEDLITNPRVCFSMIWCCVEEEAKKRGIENELEFARLFDGRAIQDARMAFYEELPGFFPEMRTTLKILIDRYSKVQKIADKKLSEKAKEMMSEENLERMVDESLKDLKIGNGAD